MLITLDCVKAQILNVSSFCAFVSAEIDHRVSENVLAHLDLITMLQTWDFSKYHYLNRRICQ